MRSIQFVSCKSVRHWYRYKRPRSDIAKAAKMENKRKTSWEKKKRKQSRSRDRPATSVKNATVEEPRGFKGDERRSEYQGPAVLAGHPSECITAKIRNSGLCHGGKGTRWLSIYIVLALTNRKNQRVLPTISRHNGEDVRAASLMLRFVQLEID